MFLSSTSPVVPNAWGLRVKVVPVYNEGKKVPKIRLDPVFLYISAQDSGQGLTFFIWFLDYPEAHEIIYIREEPLFQKKMPREFNFKALASLILISISIELQLIDWCHLL